MRSAQREAVTFIVITLGIVRDARNSSFGGTGLTKLFPRLNKVAVRLLVCADKIRGVERILDGKRAKEIVKEVKKGEKDGLNVRVVVVTDD